MKDQYWKVSRAIIFLKNQFPQSWFVAIASVRAEYGIQNLTLPSEIITKEEGFNEDFIRIYTMDAEDKFNPILEELEGHPFVIIRTDDDVPKIKLFRFNGAKIELVIDVESKLEY